MEDHQEASEPVATVDTDMAGDDCVASPDVEEGKVEGSDAGQDVPVDSMDANEEAVVEVTIGE